MAFFRETVVQRNTTGEHSPKGGFWPTAMEASLVMLMQMGGGECRVGFDTKGVGTFGGW